MHHLVNKFLTDAEKENIRNAVKEVEKITSGEIVPMVVSASYSYPLSNFIGAFSIAMIIALITVLVLKNDHLWLFMSVYMAAFIIIYELIKYILPLKRLFISDKEINAEVEEAAVNAFYKNDLYKTRDKTGVLIYISVFEKKVWVLADKGISCREDPKIWQEIVTIIVNGIKEKRQTDAIVKAIARTGEILGTHFPVKKDDTNELTDLIIND